MDSITHVVVGACMGEVFAGKQLGKKAMLWGALAQSVPDIDFVASFWMDTASDLLAHRGFTHSILFVALITPVMALIAERWHRPHDISMRQWLLFFGGVIGAHIFLDAFNNYGTGWLEPFSHHRITFNVLYVADPFFSIGPFIAALSILIYRRSLVWNRRISMAGLCISLLYLFYCLINKYVIDHKVKTILSKEKIEYTKYFTTPAPLQNWLWYIVAGDEQGYHVGFYSLFENSQDIRFEYFPKNDALLIGTTDHEEVAKLKRFSQGFYTVEYWGDTLVFNDLRFGQMIGWQNPRQKFVFHYFLKNKADNSIVVQRGRFKYWDKLVVRNFIQRIFKD